MTAQWAVRAAKDRARSSRENRVLLPLPTKNRTFVYRQMFCFCLFKPQAWYIIDARSAAYIIKGGEPPLYLITRQRVSPRGLMIYNASH